MTELQFHPGQVVSHTDFLKSSAVEVWAWFTGPKTHVFMSRRPQRSARTYRGVNLRKHPAQPMRRSTLTLLS